MQLSVDDILIHLLCNRLPEAKLGLVVRGIRELDPVRVAATVAETLDRRLAVAVVGYNAPDFDDTRNGEAIELATRIESAVDWRNRSGEYAGRILVFVPGEVDKLGSLRGLDTVETRDLALHVIRWIKDRPPHNGPQRRFWQGLENTAATVPFNMLLDFISAVRTQPENVNAIPNELWRLGLLEDPALLNADADVEARLERNRELIAAIGQLSDKSRKRMNQVLQRAAGEPQRELRGGARQLREFFAAGAPSLLQGLRLETVEQLIEAGRPLPLAPLEGGEDDGDVPKPKPERTLRGNELAEAVARKIVGGTDPEAITAYLDVVRSRMNEPEEDNGDPVDDEALRPLTSGRQLDTNVNSQTRAVRAFLTTFCTVDWWGGVLDAEQHSLRDVVHRFDSSCRPQPLDPNAITADGPSMITLLANIDSQLPDQPGLMARWEALASARAALLPDLDLLVAEPIALLYTKDSARIAMAQYLDAYAELLRLLAAHRGVLLQHFALAYRAILQGLLRLDVVFVRTPGDQPGDSEPIWKALLTPLHPLHLWRYRTILEKTGTHLGEAEQSQLTLALPKLPHLLHFVAVKDTRLGRITLPLAGALEGLPIYENRTNRYLGSDGLDFLGDLLRSWLTFAPYSQPHIRLALIDAPYLPDALREIKDFLRGRPQTQIVVDAYRTRPQNVLEHLAEMEFEGQDSLVAELLLNGRITLNLYSCDDLPEVAKRLGERPVHVVYSFDQSSYDLTKSSRHRHLIVSPLVITYEYTFDEAYKKGSIAPSSDAESGLFADYHTLVNQAIDLQEDQSFQVQIGSGADVGALNAVLRNGSARWLAVADRTLLGYAPVAAVPLVEQSQGRREVAVWAHATSRTVSQFASMMRDRFNLLPDEEHLVHVMQQFGHIAAGGLFSAVRGTNLSVQQRDRQRKGLIGTVLAAHWYLRQYPGALIASLDSGLARLWLALEAASKERADLIGLREDEPGNLVIDIIEVKAVEHGPSEVQVRIAPHNRQVTLSGPAVSQLRSTLAIVRPIFTQVSAQLDLFGQARREALKYQLYRECFRELHADKDQYRWYKLLNAAFRERSDGNPQTTRCHGMIVHLLFEENGSDERVTDVLDDITLVRLRTRSIQKLLVPGEDIGLPPSSSSAPRNGGSASALGIPKTVRPAPDSPGAPPATGAKDAAGQNAEPEEHPKPELLGTTNEPESTPPQGPVPSRASPPPACDVLLGETVPSSQYGVLGRAGNKTVALDLNGTNTISIFGVQGGGKSYTVGTIVEMATQPFAGANLLPSPLASVVFHYHSSQDYPPEYVSMIAPNSREDEVRTLLAEYGARPEGLNDVVILTSADKLRDRQKEFPTIPVEPILFSSAELALKDWQFLMGVFGDQMYMKQATLIMRRLRRQQLTLAMLRDEIEASNLTDNQKALVNTRLDFAEPFIDEGRRLADVLRPGRLVIVDLRDELVTKEEALGLFVVMLNIFANAAPDRSFNKLIVFDEAHKYMNDDELAGYIVEVVRQMRHQGVSVLIASQDPPSLPNAIIELSTLVVLHRFNSPKWLKHVQQSVTALADLQPEQLANLRSGEAYVWAARATDPSFMRHAVKMRIRPRVTQHGGGTRRAVEQ